MSVAEKKNVGKLNLYVPARTLESVSRENNISIDSLLKLAANENRLGCSPKVAEALIQAQPEYALYPDVMITKLRNKLAAKHNVEPADIVFGNGSFELISLLAAAYIDEGDESIYTEPSFGWYINVTKLYGGVPVGVLVGSDMGADIEGIKAAITGRTKVIWLCNPNNPTGTIIAPDALTEFIESVPDNILIVLDEAYIDFAEEKYIDTVRFTKEHDNVVILRTFSKLYGLASFRIGYAIGNPAIVTALTKVKLPFNVAYASQVAAYAAVNDEDFTNRVLKNNRDGLDYYYREFDRLGMKYVRSNGNFVLVYTGIDSNYLEEEFIKRRILIRNGVEFGLDKWMRISIGTPEDNRKVIEAFDDILKKI